MPEIVGRLRPPRLAGAPLTPALGEMYYDTLANKLYWWNGTTWIDSTGGTTFPPIADVSFAGFKATNLGTPGAPTDGATKAYVDSYTIRGTYAARPAAGMQGRTYFATDTGGFYIDDTVQWRTINPPLLSALPAGPSDSDVINFQTSGMATLGLVWQFRYRGAGSTYKWEFTGGSPWTTRVATRETRAITATYLPLATAGPSVTVPLAGEYLVQVGSMHIPGVATFMVHSYDVGATGAVDIDGARSVIRTAADAWSISSPVALKAVTINTAFVSKYVATPGAGDFLTRWMSVTPVRVG